MQSSPSIDAPQYVIIMSAFFTSTLNYSFSLPGQPGLEHACTHRVSQKKMHDCCRTRLSLPGDGPNWVTFDSLCSEQFHRLPDSRGHTVFSLLVHFAISLRSNPIKFPRQIDGGDAPSAPKFRSMKLCGISQVDFSPSFRAKKKISPFLAPSFTCPKYTISPSKCFTRCQPTTPRRSAGGRRIEHFLFQLFDQEVLSKKTAM